MRIVVCGLNQKQKMLSNKNYWWRNNLSPNHQEQKGMKLSMGGGGVSRTLRLLLQLECGGTDGGHPGCLQSCRRPAMPHCALRGDERLVAQEEVPFLQLGHVHLSNGESLEASAGQWLSNNTHNLSSGQF